MWRRSRQVFWFPEIEDLLPERNLKVSSLAISLENPVSSKTPLILVKWIKFLSTFFISPPFLNYVENTHHKALFLELRYDSHQRQMETFAPLHASVNVWYAQSCPTLRDPLDCSPPGFSVHGIFQARILDWVALSYSRGSFWPRDQTCVSCVSRIGRLILYHSATCELPLCARDKMKTLGEQEATTHGSPVEDRCIVSGWLANNSIY